MLDDLFHEVLNGQQDLYVLSEIYAYRVYELIGPAIAYNKEIYSSNVAKFELGGFLTILFMKF